MSAKPCGSMSVLSCSKLTAVGEVNSKVRVSRSCEMDVTPKVPTNSAIMGLGDRIGSGEKTSAW